MSSFRIENTNITSSVNKMNYNLATGESGFYLINRGNPGQSEPLLLDTFNTIHYYNFTGVEGSTLESFDISTTMVEGGVYEVKFNCSGSTGPNNDMILYPNFVAYTGSTFYTSYQNILSPAPTGPFTIQYEQSNNSGYYFDLVGGSSGFDPVGKITIFNNTNAKKVKVEVGDTVSVCTGSGYWLTENYDPTSMITPPYDTTTIWENVGLLNFGATSFTNWNIWVKRLV